MSTGAGKTIVFSAISDRFVKKSQKAVLILVHRKELLQQTRRTLYNAFGISAQIIVAGMKHVPPAPVYVGMIESVKRRIKLLQNIGLVIIDEAHIDSFNKVHEHFPTEYIIGFTATPLAANKRRPMKMFYDDIVCGVDIPELIENKFLCQNITFAPRDTVDRAALSVKGNDFDEGLMALQFLAQKYVNNTVKAYERWVAVTKTIIFNVNIDHSKQVDTAFKLAGYDSKHLDSTMTATERTNTLNWFKHTPNAILNNVGILTAGFDEPSIESVIINKATMSMPLWLQMCLDVDTEILTKEGWKKHDNVNSGDIVGSFNINTKDISFAPCTDKFERKIGANESMYYLKSPFIDLRVTNNHNLITRSRTREEQRDFCLMEAEKVSSIKQGYEMPVSGYLNMPDAPISDDELRVVGWYLSDGTIDKSTNTLCITQSSAQPKYLHDSILRSLNNCGFKVRISEVKRKGELSKYKSIIQYRVSHGKPRGTEKHLKGWGGKLESYLDKNMSDDLMKISRRQLGVLLSTINEGDGYKNKKAYWVPKSLKIAAGCNKAYADRLQILCVTRGYKCNISTHYYNKQPLYILQIKDRDYASIKGKNENNGNKLMKSIFKKDEKVWCVSTENGTLITRRNGKVLIMGNCGRGGRTTDAKSAFTIIDMGGNAITHGDWNMPRDWENIFFNPPKAKEKEGVAPVKYCPQCDAIIAATARTCKHCGYEYPPKEQEMENELGDFVVVTKGIDVREVIESNRHRKEYYPFFKIGKDLAIAAKQSVPKLTDDIVEFILNNYYIKAQEWCNMKGKRFNQWHKERARETLYNELADRFKKWVRPDGDVVLNF